jgi:L-threonylcarbamoyladenylate synthase
MDQLGAKIPYILDGGECSVGLESTIVAEENGKLRILRLGGISVEEIEGVVGKVIVGTATPEVVHSPGSMKSHYATRTPLKLGPIDLTNYDLSTTGILSFRKSYLEIPQEHQVVLSPTGNLHEASKNLFAAMRYLDSLKLRIILAEEFPEMGLGRAINDRLRRATA